MKNCMTMWTKSMMIHLLKISLVKTKQTFRCRGRNNWRGNNICWISKGTKKNEKSPGLDGYTVEFFKFFWIDIGVFVLRSINYGYRTGLLSVTQKQGIITCLPKPNKCRYNLKNWRPISLLNVVYKMASAAIANRLKLTLDKWTLFTKIKKVLSQGDL